MLHTLKAVTMRNNKTNLLMILNPALSTRQSWLVMAVYSYFI